jgi:hypothetical protein
MARVSVTDGLRGRCTDSAARDPVQVCTVVAKKRLHGLQLRETRQMHSRHDHIADGIVRVGQSHHPVGDEEQVSLQVIANDLLEEIEVWKSTSHFRRAHPRVQVRQCGCHQGSQPLLTTRFFSRSTATTHTCMQ